MPQKQGLSVLLRVGNGRPSACCKPRTRRYARTQCTARSVRLPRLAARPRARHFIYFSNSVSFTFIGIYNPGDSVGLGLLPVVWAAGVRRLEVSEPLIILLYILAGRLLGPLPLYLMT